MRKPYQFWILAVIITLAAAYYQRLTGPTYPVSGKFKIDNEVYLYKFDRNHSGDGDHAVLLETGDQAYKGILRWKRYKTNDDWHFTPMLKTEGGLIGYLPHQPPAGKLEYQVGIESGDAQILIPPKPVIIRFKGDVPLFILIPHIIFIFLAMLLSNRTALECFVEQPRFKLFTFWTFILLVIGGMILGPIVQKYAFGEFWTGFPFGTDLTDNKTLIAFIGWSMALLAVYKDKKPKWYILIAALIMFIIFVIPHSLFGSELDYSKISE